MMKLKNDNVSCLQMWIKMLKWFFFNRSILNINILCVKIRR